MLFEKVSVLHNNSKPEALLEIQGTEVQSKSDKWCRLTASKCLSAFKIGKFVSESQPNAAEEAKEFSSHSLVVLLMALWAKTLLSRSNL